MKGIMVSPHFFNGWLEVKVTFGVMVGVRQVVVLVYMNTIDLTFMCPNFEISV